MSRFVITSKGKLEVKLVFDSLISAQRYIAEQYSGSESYMKVEELLEFPNDVIFTGIEAQRDPDFLKEFDDE